MGDLDKDTTLVARDDGRYTIRLSEEWAIWGPNGGYVASIALRAAGLASGRERPASFLGQLLGVAAFDDVDVTTVVLRRSRFATAVRVGIEQAGRPIVEALVWGVTSTVPGTGSGARATHPVPRTGAVGGVRPGGGRGGGGRRGSRRWRPAG